MVRFAPVSGRYPSVSGPYAPVRGRYGVGNRPHTLRIGPVSGPYLVGISPYRVRIRPYNIVLKDLPPTRTAIGLTVEGLYTCARWIPDEKKQCRNPYSENTTIQESLYNAIFSYFRQKLLFS